MFLILGFCLVFLFGVSVSAKGTTVMNDQSITDTVEDEINIDLVVPSSNIDVTTTAGVVTLTGTVDNILNKERAAHIAQTVKGVKAVVNRIEVKPPILRSDTRIQEDIKRALRFDPATEASEVNVRVNKNVATLSGAVDSWQERNLCETVTKGVRGVKKIENHMAVVPPEKRSDVEIETEIQRRLTWDVWVDNNLINVKVNDGRVSLSGVVGSGAEKIRAVSDAYVRGVKMVDAQSLNVERWARDKDLRKNKYALKSDVKIKKAVKSAFLYDPRVAAFKINIAVSSGIVTLRGIVDNLKAKHAALQDARNTVGVVKVNNRLKVRPEPILSDDRIELNVVTAIASDPYLEDFDILVKSRNGIVDLYGTVDNVFEKARAQDVASKVSGVVAIDNNLKVQQEDIVYYWSPYLDAVNIQDYGWYYLPPRRPLKSDKLIKEDINDELFWSPFVDANQVTVTVKNGEATLSGRVDSAMESLAAVENAYEGGAIWVDNELVISTSPQ